MKRQKLTRIKLYIDNCIISRKQAAIGCHRINTQRITIDNLVSLNTVEAYIFWAPNVLDGISRKPQFALAQQFQNTKIWRLAVHRTLTRLRSAITLSKECRRGTGRLHVYMLVHRPNNSAINCKKVKSAIRYPWATWSPVSLWLTTFTSSAYISGSKNKKI